MPLPLGRSIVRGLCFNGSPSVHLTRFLLTELTVDDILNTTQKFWEFNADPILLMDGATASLLVLHINLCSGTLVNRTVGRPDIQHTLKKLLNFEMLYVCYQLHA